MFEFNWFGVEPRHGYFFKVPQLMEYVAKVECLRVSCLYRLFFSCVGDMESYLA